MPAGRQEPNARGLVELLGVARFQRDQRKSARRTVTL
jgi:hypothetical protein